MPNSISQLKKIVQQLEQNDPQICIPHSIEIEAGLFPLTFKMAQTERTLILYLEETKLHIEQLEIYLDKEEQESYNEQIIYLIELIKNQLLILLQISQSLSTNQPQKSFKQNTLIVPNESLHQRQARYRGYLVQLQQKYSDLSIKDQTKGIKDQMDKLKQRIQKCQNAINELDDKIEKQENKRNYKLDNGY